MAALPIASSECISATSGRCLVAKLLIVKQRIEDYQKGKNMREFKFRGWDATGQKGWVYGDLIHNQKVTKTGLEPRVMVGGYEIVPESIGLWTGKKDSNGKEIYERDIIRISYNGKKVFDASVVWHSNYSAFMLDEGDSCYSLLPSEELDYIETEVIGNTFQNKTVER